MDAEKLFISKTLHPFSSAIISLIHSAIHLSLSFMCIFAMNRHYNSLWTQPSLALMVSNQEINGKFENSVVFFLYVLLIHFYSAALLYNK